MEGDCRDYLNRMTNDITAGMAFTIGSRLPKKGDKWLVGDVCDDKEQCEFPIMTTFANLEFWTHGGAQAEVDISYLGMCGSPNAGECGNDCAECRYSYPSDDPLMWNSEWAACRCKDNSVYSYGNTCEVEQDEDDDSLCGANC